MLSLLFLLASATAAGVTAPAADEIVVTAKRDKCFVQYGQHPVSDAQLEALSRTWAVGTPVRVIEPRGASIRCEFQIMKYLAKHGAHMAQFVARSEDMATPDTAPAKPAAVVADTMPKDPVLPKHQSVDAIVRAEHPPAMFAVRGFAEHPKAADPAPSGATGGHAVSLICTMADPTRPYELDVEIDEGRGTATPFRPDTGGGSEMKADFMPDAVRFGPFTISRTTLRIERDNGDGGASGPATIDGQCSLARRKRVF